MKTQHLQSLQHHNAAYITIAHAQVKAIKANATKLFKQAKAELKEARRLTETIKKRAANQVAIKKDIKGTAVKRPRVKKPDSRPKLTHEAIFQHMEHMAMPLPVAASSAP